MPDPDESPATTHDLRRLHVELADRSDQLRRELALELRAVSRSLASESRADVSHLTELALGELRVARHDLLRRDQEAANRAIRLARMVSGLLVLVIADTLLTLLDAINSMLGS